MLEAIFGIGAFMVKTLVKVTRSFILTVVEDFATDFLNKTIKYSPSNYIDEIRNINREMSYIDSKRLRGDYSPWKDWYRARALRAELEKVFNEYRIAKGQEFVTEASNNQSSYKESDFDTGRTNLLQYHMGLMVLKKRCPECDYPMLLQHRNVNPPNELDFKDFFWQCSSYYKIGARCPTIQFSTDDVKMLYKDSIPELQVTSDELNIIAKKPIVSADVKKRMQEHLKNEDTEVLCPIHHLPMILQQKRNPGGTVLDMYFLCCPNYSCGQKVKLKSPAQLAAYLNRMEGRGIL